MNSPMHTMIARAISAALCGTMLAACGGGGGGSTSPDSTAASVVTEANTAGSIYAGRGTTIPPVATPAADPVNTPVTNPGTTPGTTTPGTTPSTIPGAAPVTTPGTPVTSAPSNATAITSVRLENSGAVQTNAPVTFAQVFAPGHLAKGMSLVGRLDNGTALPLQIDVKAHHADGSVRHAIISAVVPSLAAGTTRVQLLASSSADAAATATVAQLLASGFSASFSATLDGVRYEASADQLLKQGKITNWLSGATVQEFQVMSPLTTADGKQHPHLTARFAVRWYPAAQKARVDVAVENNWTYEPAPRNFTYDADFVVGGKSVYAKAKLEHFHHARWRKLGWWGTAPAVDVRHDVAYLIASRAIPNYDQKLKVPESTLATMKSKWTNAVSEPMRVGLANPYMPATGGRGELGILPNWTVIYLLSMDKRAGDITFASGDLSGSWSSHYRDKQTDLPVSVLDYPYMTILGRSSDTYNRPLKRFENFPACAGEGLCKTTNNNDTSHQASFAYVPYLLTGDYYYLEEMQFWSMWNTFVDNPNYRNFEKGLYKPDQVRGQAWSMRSLAQVAYITPDNHPLKSHFTRIMDNNLEWYNSNYTNGTLATSNNLGVITNGYAYAYQNSTAIAPWQDDFFTQAIGHASDLGFTKADALLRWKVKYSVDRMVGAGSCWIGGAMYTMKIRDTNKSPVYETMAQAFKSSDAVYTSHACASQAMATALGLKVGEMFGYASTPIGYPSNMQPALAYAAEVGGENGKKAWAQYEQRVNKPDYSGTPQFAIIPR